MAKEMASGQAAVRRTVSRERLPLEFVQGTGCTLFERRDLNVLEETTTVLYI